MKKKPTLAEQLRQLIDKHAVPISRLAPALGVTKQTLHNQLSGKSPVSLAILLALRYAPTEELMPPDSE